MQKQISTAIASLCRNQPLDSVFRLVKTAGFDSVDFPFSTFSNSPLSPLNQPDWKSWVRQLCDLTGQYGLPITQAHASWEQGIPADWHYEAPHDLYYRTMESCRAVGCRQLIFHPLRQLERVDSLSIRQRIHAYNVRWFHDLISAAESYDIIINLENTFDSHHVQKPGDPPYPYTTAQDMIDLMRDIGSLHVQLCLDTGHANISAQDIPAMIRVFRRDLATVHLNDNYGRISPVYEDLHLFPGYGRIVWKDVFDALREVGFSGVMNIEPIGELRTSSEQVRLIQLKAAADTLRALMNE